ncbi:MAG TPA: potassium channel family protein [Chloroflexota bacterium]|nr:potassium channel family protein [Chloroflexota bacterium]
MVLSLVLEAVIGIAVVAAILVDVFLAVVVPRRAPTIGRQARVSSHIIPRLWKVWRAIGLRLNSTERREAFLGMFGSLSVILLLVAWAAGLILGYGLILDAVRAQIKPEPENLGAALYFAGVSMLTIGFGDVVPVGGAARLTSLVAAASGLGLFALVITFVFTLYGSFQRREVAVVVLEAGAGAPPSGVNLLETYALLGIVGDLPRVFADWQAWAADIMDSHLAYPILAYFRSSHDGDSWISSLGAVMDAATLVLTTLEDGPHGWAKLYRTVGGHCLEDLVLAFRLDVEPDVGLERSEFDEARLRLERAGYKLRDPDESWTMFARLRSEYAGRVNALAHYWASPPAQWIGDRSPLRFRRVHHQPRLGAAPAPNPASDGR